MDWPLKFPDPRELARERGEAFQRLSSDDRWREIFALMAFGINTVRSSPNRQAIERQMAEQEQQWRDIQTELFARHGR
jgi:hypothetical protein